MNVSIKPLLMVLAVVLFAGIGYCSMFANEREIMTIVNKVEKIEKTSSYGTGKNIHINTQVFYQVHTDRGMYRVYLDGFLAHPELANLQEGKKYRLTVCGFKSAFFGWYQNIINAYQVEE